MHGRQPDFQKLAANLKDVHEWESRNAEPYDKAILTLSSGALALSLTFIKDLVPPEFARVNWVLYLSWVLFVLSLATNISGFIYTAMSFPRQRRFVKDVYLHCTKTEAEYEAFHDGVSSNVDTFNVFQGVLFLAGMIAFTAYVIFNFEAHSQSLHAKRPTPAPIEAPRHSLEPASQDRTPTKEKAPATGA